MTTIDLIDLIHQEETAREAPTEMKRKERTINQRKKLLQLVPSANRWVPKFKSKKTEKKLAPDGKTELLDKDEVGKKDEVTTE